MPSSPCSKQNLQLLFSAKSPALYNTIYRCSTNWAGLQKSARFCYRRT
ncbi:hypothetical protein RB2187 [Rhodopirellula baltica SH 1]|uniref:Uncharacterized protein n=1 Tax=Rhodopirellula baltica (strain DSM 10527 / NCIMB 13988 / SH1) TaxID=243090 RepID=Q7UW92_RHOBA|nr:hypothetical protein RB2187 [Rhodopirellula baltica SH 1]